MTELTAVPGRVCLSRAGRDKGKYFLIMEAVDEQHVLVVDGRMRRLAAPKKKKLRHLILMHDVSESIGEKWQTGAKVFDAEIWSALTNMGYNN